MVWSASWVALLIAAGGAAPAAGAARLDLSLCGLSDAAPHSIVCVPQKAALEEGGLPWEVLVGNNRVTPAHVGWRVSNASEPSFEEDRDMPPPLRCAGLYETVRWPGAPVNNWLHLSQQVALEPRRCNTGPTFCLVGCNAPGKRSGRAP